MFPRMRIGFVATLVAAAALVAYPDMARSGEDKEYKPEVQSTTHVQELLPEDDGKTVIIKELNVPPGHVGSRHYHSGPVYVYVLEGKFSVEVEGEEPQTLSAGGLFKEPLGTTMLARNPSASSNARILVFQVGETGKPMMIKAE